MGSGVDATLTMDGCVAAVAVAAVAVAAVAVAVAAVAVAAVAEVWYRLGGAWWVLLKNENPLCRGMVGIIKRNMCVFVITKQKQ